MRLTTNIKRKMAEECVKILRETDGFDEEKANEIVKYLLSLKSLEPRLDTELKIKDYDYDFSHVVENNFEYRKNLFSVVKFSNLSKKPELEIPILLKIVWDDVLSVHPLTKTIFLPGKCFELKHPSTYKILMDKLI
jgi:ABC-type bacteriocin/lantibiotic exporter with double-glycine peptidase domain